MINLTFANGDKMPALGLGTWKSEKGEVYKAIRTAIEIGYRHFDCAFIYLNEPEIGEAFHDAITSGDVAREQLWVTSKLWNGSHHQHNVRPALEQTLSDLKLNYLDLYLIHWPVVFQPGVINATSAKDFLPLSDVPISQTWDSMESLVDLGLARHIGVSNFSVKKLESLEKRRIPPELNQIEIQPLLQQEAMVEFCKDRSIHVTAYSPLGSRDRHPSFKNDNEPDLLKHPILIEISARYDCTTAQLILAWSVNRGISVIPKSTNPQRMRENLKAADIELTDQDMSRISEMDQHFRFIDGSFWVHEGNSYTLSNLWDE